MLTADQITVASKLQHEARELERLHGRKFLERSLSEAGIRWRQLTAPNAAEWMKAKD